MSIGLEALAKVVAPSVLLEVVDASRRLAALGIPHALIGGLAVGLHGHPRATKDVDFLVGDEAFSRTFPVMVYREELAEIVRIGLIDLMGVPPQHAELRELLVVPAGGEIPVIPVHALILLKLLAGRPQDLADVHALIEAGASVSDVRHYLGEHASHLVSMFARLVGTPGG